MKKKLESFLERLVEWVKAHPKYFAGGVAALVFQIVVVRRVGLRSKALNKVASAASANAVSPQFMNFSEFLQKVESKEVSNVILGPETLTFSLKHGAGHDYLTKPVTYHPGIVDLLHAHKISFDQHDLKKGVQGSRILVWIFPFAYLAVCFVVFRKLMDQTGDAGQLSGKQFRNASGKQTTFDDVAGIDKAKGAVAEITDFMKNPRKFTAAGARVPSGILLVGPPGTGKTMLAKAMANEAGLPFFYCSGSDFVEVFAGRGASRVRKLFQRAAKNSPCVIFFDEIDALGKSRGNELSMNEEREQTLNQLLAVMDGFNSDNGIVVMAATNRFDVLDKALTRPGRFDRIVRVSLPDEEGRLAILQVHTRTMRLDDSVDLELIASATDGYSGAELASIANEAAISAVRDGRRVLSMQDFWTACDEFAQSRHNRKGEASKGFVEHLLRNLN